MQKKSLLSQSQQAAAPKPPTPSATEMALPVVPTNNGAIDKLLSGGVPVAAPFESAGSSVPYLGFYYGIGAGADAIKRALPHVRKGDLILTAGGDYVHVPSPAKVFLFTAHQHWAERVPITQQLVRASLDPQGRESALREEIEALVVVLAGDKLLPATWRAKGGACRGLVRALSELAKAQKPEWLDQSEAHKLTARVQMPWARFVAEIDYHLVTSRGGNDYVVTGASCRPIDPDNFYHFRELLINGGGTHLLDEAIAEHKLKLAEVTAKLAAS